MATLLYQPYTSSVPGFFCFVINNFLPIYKNFKNFLKKNYQICLGAKKFVRGTIQEMKKQATMSNNE